MKMKNAIISIVGTSLLGGLLFSCNYLDVSKELAGQLDKETVFSDGSYIKQWYGEIYNYIPDYSETGYGCTDGFKNPYSFLSGELVCAQPDILKYSQNTFNALDAPFHRYQNCYKEIRQALIFLENVPESVGNVEDEDANNHITAEMMDRMKADAVYLIAYYYFLMFELYGPVPIMYEIADPEDPGLDYERASVDEMINYIDSLLAQLIDGEYKGVLPETLKEADGSYNLREILRPTMAAVYALRARLWVYAASPLFNGGYEEALSITNKDGKRLFPDYDAGKWQIAKERLEDLLRFARQHNMGLYVSENNDPHLSVYELFQHYNDEILWANGNNHYNSVTSNMEARTTPGDFPGSMGNVGPYQEMVDKFFTKNGLTIEEDPSYREDGFEETWTNPCTGHADRHIFNMYANREPRFYADVTYDGKSWHLQEKRGEAYKDFGAFFSKEGGKAYKTNSQHARTGYLLYKFNNRKLINVGEELKVWGRPWVLFRLADFYLYYAEVCNEIDPNDKNIIEYLDKVRQRAGIPGYRELAKGILIDGKTFTKNIIGDYDKQKEAIRQERAVEMFAEGNYYFDLRRWMAAGYGKEDLEGRILKNNDDKSLVRTGMDITRKTADFDSKGVPVRFEDNIGDGAFYNRIVVDRYPWSKSMLLYSIPYNELQKSKLLVQNPLWN